MHDRAVRRDGIAEREDRLAWIFGSSRSGSTWLLRMLSDRPGVVPIDDPHLGHHLGVWRPIPLAWAACEDVPELTTLLELKRDEPDYFFADRFRDAWWEPLRALIRARFEAQARDYAGELRGAPTYVVKEPGSHAASLLAELFPGSRLVFLLRDGRDVVDSWLAAYRDGTWAIPGGAFAVSPSGRIPLIRWLSAVWVYRCEEVLRAFASRDPGSRVLVRYEELRRDTAGTLGRVFEALGVRVSADELAAIAARRQFERVPPGERGADRAVRVATPGGWQRNLSGPEQEAMHEILADTLARFGYPSEPASEVAAAC